MKVWSVGHHANRGSGADRAGVSQIRTAWSGRERDCVWLSTSPPRPRVILLPASPGNRGAAAVSDLGPLFLPMGDGPAGFIPPRRLVAPFRVLAAAVRGSAGRARGGDDGEGVVGVRKAQICGVRTSAALRVTVPALMPCRQIIRAPSEVDPEPGDRAARVFMVDARAQNPHRGGGTTSAGRVGVSRGTGRTRRGGATAVTDADADRGPPVAQAADLRRTRCGRGGTCLNGD